jgi:hypothetical protein
MYTCPECEQVIDQANELCPCCGADLTPPVSTEFAHPKKKPIVLSAALLWGSVLIILWAIAWFVLPWRLAGSKPAAELRTREALAALQKGLAAYEAAEGSYPRALEALGDRARQAEQSAQSVHYTLQYTAGNPNVDGRIKGYTLVARAGNLRFLNFYTDETGVFRATLEDRPGPSSEAELVSRWAGEPATQILRAPSKNRLVLRRDNVRDIFDLRNLTCDPSVDRDEFTISNRSLSTGMQ